jgi:hypothetical protein
MNSVGGFYAIGRGTASFERGESGKAETFLAASSKLSP